MYEKDAPEQSASERDEAERLNQAEKQQSDKLDQPPVPGKGD